MVFYAFNANVNLDLNKISLNDNLCSIKSQAVTGGQAER